MQGWLAAALLWLPRLVLFFCWRVSSRCRRRLPDEKEGFQLQRMAACVEVIQFGTFATLVTQLITQLCYAPPDGDHLELVNVTR
jgi:hypothetical protein